MDLTKGSFLLPRGNGEEIVWIFESHRGVYMFKL